jgi:hypothetical protein
MYEKYSLIHLFSCSWDLAVLLEQMLNEVEYSQMTMFNYKFDEKVKVWYRKWQGDYFRLPFMQLLMKNCSWLKIFSFSHLALIQLVRPNYALTFDQNFVITI